MRSLSSFLGITLLVAGLCGCLGARPEEPDAIAASDTGKDTVTAATDSGVSSDGSVADAAVDVGAPEDTGTPIERLGLGEACVASAECESGRCALPCEGYGACVPATCAADADCTVDGETTHCCVEGLCSAIPGDSCGGRNGAQGASCGAGGQSDCKAGLLCLDGCVSTSFCSVACDSEADCTALDPTLACYKVVGGDMRCVPDPEAPLLCGTKAECIGTQACTLNISFDGTGIVKMCMDPVGPKGLGMACAKAQDCAAGFCFSGLCTGGCVTDDDCACNGGAGCVADQTCLDVWFTVGGTPAAEKMCYPPARCGGPADCTAPDVCALYAERDGWSAVCTTPATGAKATGAACTENEQCATNACHEGVCRDTCEGSCTEGLACKLTTMPGTPVEGAKAGLCL